MAPSFTIRTATATDAAALSAFAARTFKETFGRFNTPENMASYLQSNFAPELQAREIAEPRQLLRLAIPSDGGEIAAYSHLRRKDTGAELKRIYVDAAHHGHGLAALLLEDAKERAREWGARELTLAVWEHNARAIAFYRKHGFVEFGSVDFMLGDELQRDLAMRLSLS